MPNNSVNNTQGLSDTGIGVRQMNSATATSISKAISRGNFDIGLEVDEKVQRFYEVVYKLVSTWSTPDKLAILAEYGELSSVRNTGNEREVNKATATTLIVNLDREDLAKLMNDVKVRKGQLIIDIKEIEGKKGKLSRYFNIRSFEDTYGHVIGAKTAKDYKKLRKEYDKSYKVPKYLMQQYKNLRTELQDVLETCFNKVELNGIAVSMGIEVEKTETTKSLTKKIINKTVLYVDLIIGRSKQQYGGGIVDPKPYDNLLSYTSFSFVTGKPGLDPSEWAKKKDAARRAKAQIAERMRQKKKRASRNSAAFREVSGLSGSKRSVRSDIRSGYDTGVLADADLSTIMELAGKYGVKTGKRTSLAAIKEEIYRAMAADKSRYASLEKKNAKQFGKDRLPNRYNDDILQMYKPSGGGSVSSSGVPLVSFSAKGDLVDTSITKAVPVYLVGQGGAGAQKTQISSFSYGIGGSKTTKNISTTTPTELDPKDKRILNGFLSASEEELNTFINKELEPKVKDYILTRIRIIGASDPDTMKKAVAYVWADINGKKQLCNYISTKYGISFPNSKSKAAKFNRAVDKASIATLSTLTGSALTYGIVKSVGLKGLGMFSVQSLAVAGTALLAAGIIKGIKRNNPTKLEDMNEKSRTFYVDVKNQVESGRYVEIINELVFRGNYNSVYMNQLKYEIGKCAENRTDKPGEKVNKENRRRLLLNILIYLYAGFKGHRDVQRFIEHDSGIKNDTLVFGEKDTPSAVKLKDLKKRESFFNTGSISGQGLRRFKNGIANVFRSKGKTPGNLTLGSDTLKNTDDNPGQRYPIPKIGWDDTLQAVIGKILEVVPVYVVNSAYLGVPGSSTITDPYVESLKYQGSGANTGDKTKGRNRDLTIKKYQELFPEDGMDDKGYIGKKYIKKKEMIERIEAKTTKRVATISSPVSSVPSIQDLSAAAEALHRVNEDVPDFGNINTANLRKIVAKASAKLDKDTSTVIDETTGESYSLKSNNAMPVYLINQPDTTVTSSWLANNLPTILSAGFGTEQITLSAPYGVGAGVIMRPGLASAAAVTKIKEAANNAAAIASGWSQATGLLTSGAAAVNTGATITRMATGGTAAITGDSAGANIFRNGAKPELVQSTGNMTVTPLNPMATTQRQKVSRMSSTERKQALATGIASHIVKFRKTLPEGITEVSNTGEAIKVYSINPGITDKVDINGTSMSLMELLVTVNAQLAALNGSSTTGNELLAAIASNTKASASKGGKSESNPFAGGFPSSLDGVLEGV